MSNEQRAALYLSQHAGDDAPTFQAMLGLDQPAQRSVAPDRMKPAMRYAHTTPKRMSNV